MEMLPLKNWNMIIFIIKMLFIKKAKQYKRSSSFRKGNSHPLHNKTLRCHLLETTGFQSLKWMDGWTDE